MPHAIATAHAALAGPDLVRLMKGVVQRVRPLLARGYAELQAAMLLASFRQTAVEPSLRRVTIVAALGRGNGIAAGARLQAELLSGAGFDVELVDATPALRNPLFRAPHRPASAYVVHCGGPQTPLLLSAVMPHARHAWRIGYWAWELPDPPRDWSGFDRLLHEIWTPSRFSRDSLQRLTNKRIEVVPHIMAAAPRRERDRTNPFTVLAFADSRSSLTRKNPLGALACFRSAFGDDPKARMILKLSGHAAHLGDVERAAAGCSNVTVLRDFLDGAALAALYRSADALLSMHRAEGFGLPMLEAMAHGVPVVATSWSGNLDFMNARNASLVPARLVPVEDEAGIYSGSLWAEPDLGIAAAALRRLKDDEAHWTQLSIAAHETVVAMAHPIPEALRRPEPRRDQLRAILTARMAGTASTHVVAMRECLNISAASTWKRMNGDRT